MKRRRMRLKRLADTATYVAQIQMLHRCPFHSCSLFSWKNNYDSDRSEREACNKTIDLKIQRDKKRWSFDTVRFGLPFRRSAWDYEFINLPQIWMFDLRRCEEGYLKTERDRMGRWEKSIAVGKRIEPKCKTFGSGFPDLSSPGRILSNLKRRRVISVCK